MTYKSYKNLSNDLLRDDFNSLLCKENMTLEFTSLTSFTKIFTEIFDKHAPIKKKYIPANHASFFIKSLQKAIILRSSPSLWNIFLKEKSLESKKAYIKQRNICVSMVKEVKKEHFQKINLSKITDNKKF